MDYAALKKELDAYRGPVMEVLPPEFENYEPEMIGFSIPALGRTYDVEVEPGGYRFTGPNGGSLSFQSVMQSNRSGSNEMTAVMADSFGKLRDFAALAWECFPDMTQEQRDECCGQLKSYWQAATMECDSGGMVHFDRPFENAMAGVGSMQEGFLDYIRSGSDMYAQYYADGRGDKPVWNLSRMYHTGPEAEEQAYIRDLAGGFENASKNSVSTFMALYDSGFAGLSESESKLLSDLAVSVKNRCEYRFSCGEEAAFREEQRTGVSRPYIDHNGVTMHDFDTPFPAGTYYRGSVLDASMPGVARFELTEVPDTCGRDFREKARELGLEPATAYGQLMNSIEDYRGPRLIVERSSDGDFTRDAVKGIDVCAYNSDRHLQYMYRPDEAHPDMPMVGPYGERSFADRIIPMDLHAMAPDDAAVRVEEMTALRDIARKAYEEYWTFSPEEAAEICDAVNLMWQGNTLGDLGVNDGHGRMFDAVQSHVEATRRDFLKYVETGCDAFAAYYDHEVSHEDAVKKLGVFTDFANGRMEAMVDKFDEWTKPVDIYDPFDNGPRLSDNEADAVVGLIKTVNEAANERVATTPFEGPVENMPKPGIRPVDFGMPVPAHMYAPQLEANACALVDAATIEYLEWYIGPGEHTYPSGLGEMEALAEAEMQAALVEAEAGSGDLESSAAGIESMGVCSNESSARDMRDLEMAADDIVGNANVMGGPDAEYDY